MAKILSQQKGGTITGFIVGLVVGLGIAVAVAMVITKSSTPFTTKAPKPDISTLQLQDPNKPLYGNRNATDQAAKETAANKKTEEELQEEAKKNVEARKAEELLNETIAKAAAADAAKANNHPITPPTPAASDNAIYYLQVGAFKNADEAENNRAKLALFGFEGSISEKKSNDGVLHRVRVGPFNTQEEVNQAKANLSGQGVESVIVKSLK